ncbi:MAG: oligosaccharide flippase family protein [Rhodothermales bacterium]
MKRLRARFSHLLDDSGFRGPVLKLLTGTGYAFILAYVAKTILLRMYDPGDFGIYAAVFAIVSICQPLVTLRYEDALMISDTPRKAAHAFVLSMGVLIGMCMLLLVLIPLRHEIEQLFGEPAMADWIWTVPVVLFIQRGAKTMELWLSRNEQFSLISGGQVAQSTVMTVVRIGAGFVRASPGGLIFGFALGHLAQAALYVKRMGTSVRAALEGSPGGLDTGMLREVAVRYRKFPMFTTPAAMISAGVSQLPALLLLYYFNKEVLGIYSQAFAVLFIPMSQLAMTIAQVFFVRAVEAHREGTLAGLSENIHKRMVMLVLPVTAVLMVVGGDVFEFLFSATWRASGEYLLFLGPWILFTTVSSPLTRLFDVLERQRFELVVAIIMFVVLTGAMIVGGRTGDVTTTMIYLGVGGAAVRIFSIVLLTRLARVPFRRVIKPYVRYTLVCSPLLVALHFIGASANGLVTTFSACVALGLFGLYVIRKEQLLNVR